MPIPEDEFQAIDADGHSIDLTPDTTQGKIYGFLLANAAQAFRQREVADAVEVPRGSVGPTLARLEEYGLVEHRGRYWKIADSEHATAAAGLHSVRTADAIDGGFSEEAVDAWMETAVDPIDERDGDDGDGA